MIEKTFNATYEGNFFFQLRKDEEITEWKKNYKDDFKLTTKKRGRDD